VVLVTLKQGFHKRTRNEFDVEQQMDPDAVGAHAPGTTG